MSLIPGTLIARHGVGILLRGPAGSGKSDIALQWLRAGHQLISDDSVDVQCEQTDLMGHAPAAGVGMLYLRGLGLIDVSTAFGPDAIAPCARIALVIDLTHDPVRECLEGDWQQTTIAGIHCPMLRLSSRRPIGALLDLALDTLGYRVASTEKSHF